MDEVNEELKYFPSTTSLPYDWTYTKRREMQEITPGLYLGPYSAASKSKLNTLVSAGITHIICITHGQEAQFVKKNFPDKFVYLTLDIMDSSYESILKFLPLTKAFIDNAMNNMGKVLVHGNTGTSRSASIVIAYVMEKYGLELKETLSLVQQRRLCVSPNEGFMAQLKEFEPIYRAHRMLQNEDTQEARNKRHFEEMENS